MSISGVIVFGPLEENEAMNGAGFMLSCAVGTVINPRGSLSNHTINKNMKKPMHEMNWKKRGADRILGRINVGKYS